LFTTLALALLLASPSRADVFDEADGKDGDPKHTGTGEEEALREQRLWEAYVKKLGDGPIYRVEVLYRGPGADHITYCRHYVSTAIPSPHGLFGYGVNARGEVVPPGDPGHEPMKAALEARKVGKNDEPPPPPLATRTRYVGGSLHDNGSYPGTAWIHSSDHGAYVPLPKKSGEPELMFFGSALFRLELVTPQDVLKAGPLRQDAKLCRERTAALRREIISTGRERSKEYPRDVVHAAYLFRDAELIGGVRQMLDDWIARPPAEVVGQQFPTYLADCLGDLGDERDLAAFHRLTKRHPDHAVDLHRPTLDLLARVGTVRAMPLVEDLLNGPLRRGGDGRMQVLRELAPTIPEFTDGDLFLIETVRRFQLKPGCFELRSAQQTLDALQRKQPLTPAQQRHLRTCHLSDHVFLTEAARRRGVEMALDWFKEYQPPANK
jgi:hypothetical protein